MHIGGLLKHSLIDYPGTISCVVFLSGCNFFCPFCHNPGLVGNHHSIPSAWNEDRFEDFLLKRKEFIEGVVISGGEPTLQANLDRFCEKLKQLGFVVKLDTNGSRPQVIRHLLERQLVDYVAMDIKTDPQAYAPYLVRDYRPEDILESIRMIMTLAPAYEFRTTCVRPFLDATIIHTILDYIEGARRYCLQRFKRVEVLCPDFFNPDSEEDSDGFLEQLEKIAFGRVQECIVR